MPTWQQVGRYIDRIDLPSGRDEAPVDGRLLCFLYRANGDTDTLVFSRLRMEHNGLVYDTDTDLLRLVATTQSEDYRETIERWITVIKANAKKKEGR